MVSRRSLFRAPHSRSHRRRVRDRVRNARRVQVEFLEPRYLLAVFTWDGGADTFEWNDAQNWDNASLPDTLPGPADDAVIPDLPGISTISITGVAVDVKSVTADEKVSQSALTFVTIAQNSTFNAGLDFVGDQTFTAGGIVIVKGTSNWGSTGITGSIRNQGDITISPSSPIAQVGNLINDGTVTLVGSLITGIIRDSAIVNKPSATFTLQGQTLIDGASGSFTNQGSLRKVTGAGSNVGTIDVPLDNLGTVDVVDGTLTISDTIVQHSGSTLTGGTWIADFDFALLDIATGSNITTIGVGASVSTAGNNFPKLDELDTVQGIFNVTSGGSFFPAPLAGSLTNEGLVTVGSASVLGLIGVPYFNSGGTTVLDQGQITADLIGNNGGGIIAGRGLLDAANVAVADGTLRPGNTPGILSINGNLSLNSSSVIDIEVGGTDPGNPDFDQILVTGSAALGGILNVTLINDFIPDASESFRIIDATGGRAGDFDTKNFPQRNGLDLFDTSLGATFYDLMGTAFVVRNTNGSGAFSLDQAIALANSNVAQDQILFNIPGAGVHTIHSGGGVRGITDTVILDATSQHGFAGTPLIEVKSTLMSGDVGMQLAATAPASRIRGLAINRFSIGMRVLGNNNTVAGNFIGTDPTGTLDLGINLDAIEVSGTGNTIGGVTAADRNVISGSDFGEGISITGGSNSILGNYIGTDVTGTVDLGNTGNGIFVASGANGNRIAGNLVSGNNATGILLQSNSNKVQGNKIGTDAAGAADLGNSLTGVWMYGGSSNFIGVDGDGSGDAAEGNLISGNNANGVNFQGESDNNVIAGNLIGTNALGTAAIPNGAVGINFFSDFLADDTRIGTDANGTSDDLERNIISGNDYGIVDFGVGTIVAGNYVGTTADGLSAIPNAQGGISLASADAVVGGTSLAVRNVISGNSGFGINISTSAGVNNTVIGNYIGVDVSGNTALANSGNGIDILSGAGTNTIGGLTAGAGNVISGNSGNGITVSNTGLIPSTIQGNLIGLGADGSTALGNVGSGISLELTSQNIVIGGDDDDDGQLDGIIRARNVIADNLDGISVSNQSGATTIQGNYIGTDSSGLLARGNHRYGIADLGAADTAIGGLTDGAGNVISANGDPLYALDGGGIQLYGIDTKVLGNKIGLNQDGSAAIGDQPFGIQITDGSDMSIGGVFPTARNIIGGNTAFGIHITGSGATNNTVANNYIGTNANGDAGIPNDTGIMIQSGASSNIIGGPLFGAGNVISGNIGSGVEFTGAGTTGNFVQGNYIGTNAAGSAALANGGQGIFVNNSAVNTIGGTSAAARNVISGNADVGVQITQVGSTGNLVQGNYIGIDAAGTGVIPNGSFGVAINDAVNNTVGGTAAGAGNVVSGNALAGVTAGGVFASGNQIVGNFVGTDHTGTMALPNHSAGVRLHAGGNGIVEGNLLSGNDFHGVELLGGTVGNVVRGNIIGLNVAGTAALPNGVDGVVIGEGSSNNTIGGTTVAARNIISGNAVNGVLITGAGTSNNFVQGNYIGTDVTGAVDLGNTEDGIHIEGGAHDNTIGGTSPIARNIISANNGDGIEITGSGTTGNVVQGNLIGVDGRSAPTGAVGWWRGEGNADDFQGTNHGTIVNEVSFSTGLVDQAFSFDGVDDHVNLGSNPSLDLTGSLTYSVWVNAAAVAGIGESDYIIADFDSSGWVTQGSLGFFNGVFYWAQGTSQFELQEISGATSVNTNQWYYVAVVRDDSEKTVRLYVDGALEGSVNYVGHPIANLQGDRYLAGSGPTFPADYFSGRLDEPAIFNRALSFTEIQAIHNASSAGMGGFRALGNADRGVRITAGSDNNFVGSNGDGVNDSAERNIISANAFGVGIDGSGTTGNTVAGNFIGTDPSGTRSLGNTAGGVLVHVGASGNTIGGAAAGSRNVISGNTTGHGVQISDSGTNGNTVLGNYIGTNSAGTAALPNQSGVFINAENNTVGGPLAASRNVISGNTGYGVITSGTLAFGNLIQNNYIGTDWTGQLPVGNSIGASIQDGANTLRDNLISGNSGALGHGVVISGPAAVSLVAGNIIGLDADGTDLLPNAGDGVQIYGAPAVTIGGMAATDRNVISGNAGFGVRLTLAGATRNFVLGNYIGTDVSGTLARGNATDGVFIGAGANDNLIGGTVAGTRNVISGNAGDGVQITDSGTSGNTVAGNYIGTDVTGLVALGNAQDGVRIENAASSNTVGGTPTGARNVISGNSSDGVHILDPGSDDNFIQGNWLGLGSDGTTALGNALAGIRVASGRDTIIGGTTSDARNVISANQTGIHIAGSGTSLRTIIQGNYIGTDYTGTLDRGNSTFGINLSGAPNTTIGGLVAGAGNVVSGNNSDGILLQGPATTGVQIAGNFIGTDPTGSIDLGNSERGINIHAGTATISDNVISGNNGGGIRMVTADAHDNVIQGNLIGTDVSGLVAIGNGPSLGTRYGIEVDAAVDTVIGGPAAADRNVISGNIGYGIRLTNGATGTIVQGNAIGTDLLGVFAIPNTLDGIRLTGAATQNNQIGDAISSSGNQIFSNLGSGLRAENGTANTNDFSFNLYRDNLGLAIDIGIAGLTENDTNDTDSDLNFPYITAAYFDSNEVVFEGFARPGAVVEMYISAPSANGRGQGFELVDSRIEGSGDDFDPGTGSYGPIVGIGTDANANRFRFRLPIPTNLHFGSLVTAVAVGSTSEFGNSIPVGDVVSNLPPVVSIGGNVTLPTGGTLRVDGSFLDDDSTVWNATVDYGEGAGPQVLQLNPDHTFTLQNTYDNISVLPYAVTVTVTDNGSRTGTATIFVTVQNEPPVVTFNDFTITPIVNEGEEVTLVGNFSDSGLTDQHVVTIDWGDGNIVFSNVPNPDLPAIPIGARTFTAHHIYVDDGVSNSPSDSYRVVVSVSDGSGNDVTPLGLFLEEVVNVRPGSLLIDAGVPTSVVEGELFTFSGTFVDPGIQDSHQILIDWGDGSPDELVNLPSIVLQTPLRSFSATHQYSNNPEAPQTVYSISVEVVDDDEPLSPTVLATPRSMTVTNVTPSVTGVSVTPSLSILEGELVTLATSFTDPGLLDSHEVVVEWGDGRESRVQLAPGIFDVSGLEHRYRNNQPGDAPHSILVKVADNDMAPGVYSTASQALDVANVAPTVSNLQLYSRGPGNTWVAFPSSPTPEIDEADEVRITGNYSDPGLDDSHTVEVTWSSGITTAGTILDSATGLFEAIFRYADDYALATSFDVETIQVEVTDSDGESGIDDSLDVQVNNVVPVASFLPGVVTDEDFIPLIASVIDPGPETFTYSWTAKVGMTVIGSQVGGSNTFEVDRTAYPLTTIVVELIVNDDDLGFSNTYASALLVFTQNADNEAITDADFVPGINDLMVLSLGDDDVIDATAVATLVPAHRVILDGGGGSDFLFGGSGHDKFILRAGNDTANYIPVPTPSILSGIVVNDAGDDEYLFVTNSTHTVSDFQGTNRLNFSLADFDEGSLPDLGITFDMSQIGTLVPFPQDVALGSAISGQHYVAAAGSFMELIGSNFNDTLTGDSGKAVFAGSGLNTLIARRGTSDARFVGGADADEFQIGELGTGGLSTISFEGDEGADEFTIFDGAILSNIVFSGGADADEFALLGQVSLISGISFEGDEGLDDLIVFGTVLGEIVFNGGADADELTVAIGASVDAISFEGDEGLDDLIVAGTVLGEIVFNGGADADELTVALGASVDAISFEGDEGLDDLIVDGTVLGEIVFNGGADADELTVGVDAIVTAISFEGDEGLDDLIVEGTVLGEIVFIGGADADELTVLAGASVDAISFEGDEGLDDLIVEGTVLGEIVFNGGADADELIVAVGAIVDAISFEGDEGLDDLIVGGTVLGEIVFIGGADADELIVAIGAIVDAISFEGDEGLDDLIVGGTVLGEIIFNGGADADELIVTASATVDAISFEGDEGLDDLIVDGTVLGEIVFTGGADADELTIGPSADVTTIVFEGGADADELVIFSGALVDSISFEGDTGADELVVLGTVESSIGGYGIVFNGGADADELIVGPSADVTAIFFEGGADADELVVLPGGSVDAINFEGDEGLDDLVVLGTMTNEIVVADIPGLNGIVFTGGADADELIVGADASVTSIFFQGGADGDRFRNLASNVVSIAFYGYDYPGITHTPPVGADGQDIFVNRGNNIGSIRFFGDEGADVLQSTGSSISEISFEGDEGADVLVITGSSVGLGLDGIVFEGGADADELITSGLEFGSISFEGDSTSGIGDGDDTLINRAAAARHPVTGAPQHTIHFNGYGGIDAFRNDGEGWQSIVFVGGLDADVLQNNAAELTSISFEGDEGADVLENNGNSVHGIVFNGGIGADIFVNDGSGSGNMVFWGGGDADVLINTGDAVTQISFEGDEGADVLSNTGSDLSVISFEGDAGDDRFINAGPGLRDALFFGGPGRDSLFNLDTGIRSVNIEFRAEGVLPLPLPVPGPYLIAVPLPPVAGNDDGADVFANFAAEVSVIVFRGGADADVLQNSGVAVTDISFEGDEGNDSLLNLAAGLRNFTFIGGGGNDVFENRGEAATDLTFIGGSGNDSFFQRGSDTAHVTFQGDAGVDVLSNLGDRVTDLSMEGGDGNDRMQNNGDDLDAIEFVGGLGDDAFQNNGSRIGWIHVEGNGTFSLAGSDADTVLNNGSEIELIEFAGGAGADTLINTGSNLGTVSAVGPTGIVMDGGPDADLLRVQGAGLARLEFDGAGGDDALLWNASGAAGASVTFLGGSEQDVLSFRGSSTSLSFDGGPGADRVMISGAASTAILDGADGDDRYEFAGVPQGLAIIGESYGGLGDTSSDTLDFSAFVDIPVSIDLASLAVQPQPPLPLPSVFAIQLLSAMSIENVLGTSGADTIIGNDRDNYLGGAQFFNGPISAPIAQNRPAQWVLLDFDSETEIGLEHVYTTVERDAIQQRLYETYYGPEAMAGTPAAPWDDPARWFNVRFTQDLVDITLDGAADFVTIKFNETPSYGRPGGESSEVDFGNASLGGTASVQVNGLLGGIELPTSANADFMEQLPEDAEQTIGQEKPPADSENFVALSAKIAAHEFAHLLGLRHYDSFGPVGFGIHAPPGGGDFNPDYSGAAAAFETFDHIIGSPASIGSDRFNDVGQLFFGEREAVKLAVAMSDPASVTAPEQALPHADRLTAQPLNLVTVQVPNTLGHGLNSSKSFFVEAMSVTGEIKLQGPSSESDFYSFAGQAGETFGVEVMSKAMRRFTNNGVDGYIDSVLRLYDASGSLVGHYNSGAMNDDEFESTDSVLLDVVLPADGIYFIEVDTFLEAEPDLVLLGQLTGDAHSIYEDAINDTDIGQYELFLYRFGQASSHDLHDILVGRGGIDILEDGPGDFSALELDAVPVSPTVGETQFYAAIVGFADPGGESWTATIDYGDGTIEVRTDVTPLTGVPLNHDYDDNDEYVITITVQNDDYSLANAIGTIDQDSFAITVFNLAPTATLNNDGPVQPSALVTVSFSGATDPSTVDSASLHYSFALTTAGLAGTYGAAGTTASQAFSFATGGSHTVFGRIFDKDEGYTDYTTIVVVNAGTSDASVELIGNVLQIIGTDGRDLIFVDQNDGMITVDVWFDISWWDHDGHHHGHGDHGDDHHHGHGDHDDDDGPDDHDEHEHEHHHDDSDYQHFSFSLSDVTSILILGLDGNDFIHVDGSVMIPAGIDGGGGDDYIRGGSGNDSIVDMFGDNRVHAGAGSDLVTTGNGCDRIWTDGGNDTIHAGGGNNRIHAGSGNNVITAGNGDDRIWTDWGNDTINAGDGDNSIWSGAGDDLITTGNGNDDIWTDGGNDTIHAGAGNNDIHSGSGNDIIDAGSGRDRIWSDGGNDTIDAGDGNNTVDAGSGNDRITTGTGSDEINAGNGADLVWAGSGNDTLRGGSGNDILVGGEGDDLLIGGEGRDLMIGGFGADNLEGEAGDDILVAGGTVYENNQLALESILAEWGSSRSYGTRVSNLGGTGSGTRLNGSYFLNDTTVIDDGVRDTLTGDSGVDWFLLNRDGDGGVSDRATDANSSEIRTDIDV